MRSCRPSRGSVEAISTRRFRGVGAFADPRIADSCTTRPLTNFWRGKRLREIEPRLKPGGKYEMASLVLHEADAVDSRLARRLTEAAVALNDQLGDPTDL